MRSTYQIVRPPRLKKGDGIGVFTPSSPLYTGPFLEKFQHGVSILKNTGFNVQLGSITGSKKSEGYRSAGSQERADEFMNLYRDPKIQALISTVGGYNTSSFIDLLDFDYIRKNPKIVMGYSDMTSLHCALFTQAGLSSFYGPAVFPSFGEWPEPPSETMESFLDAVVRPWQGPRELARPQRWSRHYRNAINGDWKNIPRNWNEGEGWNILRPGTVEGPLFALNLNTLLTHAGTTTFPNFEGAILIVEDESAPLGDTERGFVHLKRLGVFEKIKALGWGRIEHPDEKSTPESYNSILKEFVPSHIPLFTDCDICHTVPMLTVGLGVNARLEAIAGEKAKITILEPMVTG